MHNVLFIDDKAIRYGAEAVMTEYVLQLDRRRFSPLVLLPTEGALATALRTQGIEVVCYGRPYGLHLFQKLPLLARLVRLITTRRITLVHLNSPSILLSDVIGVAAWLCQVPLIIHQHDLGWVWPYGKLWYKSAARIVCVSDAVRQALLRPRRSDPFCRLPAEKLQVLYNGINLSALASAASTSPEIRQELGLAGTDPLVVLVGRVDANKNQAGFVQAAEIVRQSRPDCRFLIVGDSPGPAAQQYRETVVTLIRARGLTAHVHLLGYRDDAARIMRAATVVVLTSRSEGLPTVLMEAMALKKPVVAAAVGGVPELVGSNGAGLLLTDHSPAHFAEAILAVLNDPARARALGEHAAQRVAEQFEIRRRVQELEALYEQVLA